MNKKRYFYRSFLIVLLMVKASLCFAQSATPESQDAWRAVLSGEAVVVMRHALAPGVGDPTQFSLQRCETQRNLSDEGRQQAVAVGNVLRDNGIKQATVLSSQWCRCIETAKLLNLGTPEPADMLNSFFQARERQGEQTLALKTSLRQWLQEPSSTYVLVTHQVNITALTGAFVRSGEMLIVSIDDNEPVVLASIETPY